MFPYTTAKVIKGYIIVTILVIAYVLVFKSLCYKSERYSRLTRWSVEVEKTFLWMQQLESALDTKFRELEKIARGRIL